MRFARRLTLASGTLLLAACTGVAGSDAGDGSASDADDTSMDAPSDHSPSDANPEAGPDASTATCTAQTVESCSCAGGGSGTRECLPTGVGHSACECTNDGAAVYVATTGDDANDGSEAHPKATLAGALAVVRTRVSNGALPSGGVVVWMAGGVYPAQSTVTFDASLGSGVGHPLVIRARPGAPVRLDGATRIPADAFSPLGSGDPAFARTDASARSHIVVADLRARGITDVGMLAPRGFGEPTGHTPSELFVDGAAVPLARWPDADADTRVVPSPTGTSVDLYGDLSPAVGGHFTATGTNDGVSIFVRDGLVDGRQYRLFRHQWMYNGQSYRAWFLTTSPVGYPNDTDPWWSLYADGFSAAMEPSAGATGRVQWFDPAATNHGTIAIAHAVSDTVFQLPVARVARWQTAPDAWAQGLWKYGWADSHQPIASVDPSQQTVTLGHMPNYGIADGMPFYAYNLLEELDAPGEWYIDRATGRLYLYPPHDLATSVVSLSTLDAPIVQFDNVEAIEMHGIVFEGSRRTLATINDGSHNRLVGVTLRNGGADGATISGTDNGVRDAMVYGVARAGVRLDGGDRPTLTPAANFVTRSALHHYARWDWSYSAAVVLSGVEQHVENNFIHDAPHNAILYSGNEHRIERNDITRVLAFTSDAGAIYGGRDWGGRGVIIRNNYLHDLHTALPGYSIAAIYLDDCLSGIGVDGNVITDVGGIAVLHGGGRDDLMTGNVIVRSTSGLRSDARCTTWARPNDTPGDSGNLLEKLLLMHYQSPPWSVRYPACAAIPDNYPDIFAGTWLFPEGSTFDSNVAYQVDTFMGDVEDAFAHFERTNDVEIDSSPFVNEASGDLSQSPAVLAVPGFHPIPVDQIGIHE